MPAKKAMHTTHVNEYVDKIFPVFELWPVKETKYLYRLIGKAKVPVRDAWRRKKLLWVYFSKLQ